MCTISRSFQTAGGSSTQQQSDEIWLKNHWTQKKSQCKSPSTLEPHSQWAGNITDAPHPFFSAGTLLIPGQQNTESCYSSLDPQLNKTIISRCPSISFQLISHFVPTRVQGSSFYSHSCKCPHTCSLTSAPYSWQQPSLEWTPLHASTAYIPRQRSIMGKNHLNQLTGLLLYLLSPTVNWQFYYCFHLKYSEIAFKKQSVKLQPVSQQSIGC